MAKRMTDTEKWKKPFLRGLKGAYKLLWLYILDDCDHAGIWIVDMEVASLRIGEQLDAETALRYFTAENSDRVQVIHGGQKWFIRDFIEFQYGELNSANRVHKSIIELLKREKIKPLGRAIKAPSNGAKDKDQDKDKDQEKDTGVSKGDDYDRAMNDFIEMRKRIKKPATERAIELVEMELEKLAPGDVPLQIQILDQSTRKSWQDVYALKDNRVQDAKPEMRVIQKPETDAERLAREYREKYETKQSA